MIKIMKLSEYDERISGRIRTLLIQLSRSGKDKGEIPREWFEQIISSPWHDLLLAIEVTNQDFVVDIAARGKGIGSLLFQAYEDWAKEKGCKNLEFTCGHGRETAQAFYKSHGAEIYSTNFFRKKLDN